MNKATLKKIGKISFDVLVYLFLLICVFCVLVAVFSKKNQDGSVNVFGRQLRIVETGSMGKTDLTDVSNFKVKSIPKGSMVIIKLAPTDEQELNEWYANIEVGDVLTIKYVYVKQITITHRVVEKHVYDNGYKFILEGDNKTEQGGQLQQVIDTRIDGNPNYIVGKVTGKMVLLGKIITLIKQPVGVVFIIVIPCLIIIGLEIFKIISLKGQRNKEETKAQLEEKESEIQQLREKLAMLEEQNNKDGNQ